MTIYFFIFLVGLLSGCLSGVIGTGASIILLPILVFQFGPQQAVPIMAIAGLMGNVGKIWAWWREVDWRAFFAFSVTAVPGAMLGARTLLVLPANNVELMLGCFFLIMIPVRRWLRVRNIGISAWHLAIFGAAIGFLTGMVPSTGPLMVPAFAAFGLLKGALLSTEAVSSIAITITKIATFRTLGALPFDIILKGLLIGSSVMAGTFIGKAVVQRMSGHAFQILLDGLLLVSGLSMIWAATR
jgi:uncharacterized membrane protein YfcA